MLYITVYIVMVGLTLEDVLFSLPESLMWRHKSKASHISEATHGAQL